MFGCCLHHCPYIFVQHFIIACKPTHKPTSSGASQQCSAFLGSLSILSNAHGYYGRSCNSAPDFSFWPVNNLLSQRPDSVHPLHFNQSQMIHLQTAASTSPSSCKIWVLRWSSVLNQQFSRRHQHTHGWMAALPKNELQSWFIYDQWSSIIMKKHLLRFKVISSAHSLISRTHNI